MAKRRDPTIERARTIILRTCWPLITFGFFITIAQFAVPLYMITVFLKVVPNQSYPTLFAISAFVLGLLGLSFVLEVARDRIMNRLSVQVDRILSERVFSAAFRNNVNTSGRSTAVLLTDIDSIRMFLNSNQLQSMLDLPFLPIFVLALWIVSPVIGLVMLGAMVFMLLLAFFNDRVNQAARVSRRSTVDAVRFVEGALRNAEIIHALGMMKDLRNEWGRRRASGVATQAQVNDRTGVLSVFSSSSRTIVQLLVMAIAAHLVIQGVLPVGMLIFILILVGKVLGPIDGAVSNWRGVVQVRDSWDRIEQLLKAAPEPEERTSLPTPSGRIQLERVAIVPPSRKTATVNNLTLTIEPGWAVGVIGQSGAGKSSLARALVNIWPPARGAIRFDGANLSQWHPEDLGRHIGYVPQDVELFEGSVASNIARFTDATAEEVIAAARAANVHDMILRFPQGYDTEVGTGGQQLSGGQRQQVALARALFGDPPIVVLDEPNSSLDDEGEQKLHATIKGLTERGRTVIVITHKPSLLRVVDHLLVLRNGVMDKFGERDEVLATLRRPAVVKVQGDKAAHGAGETDGPDGDGKAGDETKPAAAES